MGLCALQRIVGAKQSAVEQVLKRREIESGWEQAAFDVADGIGMGYGVKRFNASSERTKACVAKGR